MTIGPDGRPVAPEPRPAATVVLVRPAPDGLEVLLTQRPATMAFAADVHVFPGGRVDPGDADPAWLARSPLSPDEAAVRLGGARSIDPEPALAAHVAAIREAFEEAGILLARPRRGTIEANDLERERTDLLAVRTTFVEVADRLDLELATDALVPLSRWVTPAGLTRRFDVRFFVAALPPGAEPSYDGGEVVAARWLEPLAGLRAMTDGEIVLWPPTATTLQQLGGAATVESIADRYRPGPVRPTLVEPVGPGLVRIETSTAGGMPGRHSSAWLIGDRDLVLVDPGDPTADGPTAILDAVVAADARIVAIVLTDLDPDRHAGLESLAFPYSIPVFAGAGADRLAPYRFGEPLGDGPFALGDRPVHVRRDSTGGPAALALRLADGSTISAAGRRPGSG